MLQKKNRMKLFIRIIKIKLEIRQHEMKKNLLETMMKMLKEKFDVKRETQVQ